MNAAQRRWTLASFCCIAAAQTLPPAFEVASVKFDQSANGRGLPRIDAERLSWSGATVKRMICDAYHVQYAQVIGAPSWTDTERYLVEAKAAKPSTRDQFRQMMQSLLAERFKLALQKQTRNLPVYTLTAAKSGLKWKEVPATQPNPPDEQPAINQFHRRATMAQFASLLSDMLSGPIFNGYTGMLEPRSDAPVMVVDETGLSGVYDIQLNLSRGVDGDFASALEAALAPQGLRLQTKRAPVEVLVITHVDRTPSSN